MSSWSRSSKELVFNFPDDTGVIYFHTAHPLIGPFPWALGKDPHPTPQLSGRARQRPSTREPLADTFSSLIQYALLI